MVLLIEGGLWKIGKGETPKCINHPDINQRIIDNYLK